LDLFAALRHKRRALGSIHSAPFQANKADPTVDQPESATSHKLIYRSV
jgi:hypothetical protein